MAIQCADIETLVQTYLDGELAREDIHDLEAHVAGCSRCNEQVVHETRSHHQLRACLTAPAAPVHLRGQLLLALDREGWSARKEGRSLRSWTLPAAASLAAVAALLLFIVSAPRQSAEAPVTVHAVRQHIRRPPIEVQGAAVTPWVKQHMSPMVSIPRFSNRNTSLRGARLSHLGSRDAVQIFYRADVNSQPYDVTMMIVDASDLNLRNGRRYMIGGRELWAGQYYGYNVVTHKDANGIGYVFTSEMSTDHLLGLVETSDLILRTSEASRR